MPFEQIVEQQIKPAEEMTADVNTVQVEQPKQVAQMSTSGDEVGLRGGESASCNCCGCGCSEYCC